MTYFGGAFLNIYLCNSIMGENTLWWSYMDITLTHFPKSLKYLEKGYYFLEHEKRHWLM
jgi:hypothetical protein